MGKILRSLLVAGMCASFPAPGAGQVPVSADGSSVQTREDLERLLVLYQDVLESPAYSDAAKTSTRQKVRQVERRLEEGDFRLGDRIALSVAGETTLPDTVPVEAGPKIILPVFGEISLRGVLRSELEDHLTQALGEFILSPEVRAEGLMRVSIQGGVGRPGFYVVPASSLLGETLMAAGGPATNGDLDDLRIERGSEVLLEGEELQEALRQGYSLDQLNLQAGDEVYVPQRNTQMGGGGLLQTVGMISGLIGSVTFLIFRFAN